MKLCVNSLGIILSTAGAFLVWHFIAQINFADKEAYLRGEGLLITGDPEESDIRKLMFSMMMSRIGMALIVIGGSLQLVSNYLD